MNDRQQQLWRDADAAFDRLLDLPEAQRDAALDALPDELRAAVGRLLQAHAQQGLLDRSLLRAERVGAGEVPERIGDWQLGEELGRGGMAVVYRAHRELSGGVQHAALKLMTVAALAADGRRRFLREHRVLARLAHPQIAALLDAGVLDDGTPYLAMQRVDGVRIDHWCRHRALDPRAIVRLFLQVCDAVVHAHRQLVVHRDLKPGNVMVDADGRVRLLDFGIARLLDDAVDGDSTRTEFRALTPQYAAPEQFSGQDSGTAADVFGLGAVLYHLLTGRPPRLQAHGQNTRITQPSRAAAEAQALSLSQRRHFSRVLRGDLDAILLAALELDPRQRYPDASAMADDLRRWLDQRPVQAARAGTVYRLRKFAARHRGGVAASLLLAGAIIAGLVGTLWQAQRAEVAAIAARLEADNARAARADSEASLQRAEALRSFLLGLFRASRPLRPQEEMPSTDELLATGAERALAMADDDPLLGAEMLSAIGTVYLERRMGEQAAPLVERAAQLVADRRDESPRIWARATLLAGQQAMLARDFAAADQVFAEIDEVLAERSPDDLLRFEARYERARILLIEEQPEAAVAALETLRDALSGSPQADRQLALRVANLHGWALGRAGRYADADRVFEQVIALSEQEHGARHLNTAVHRANAAGNAMRLGLFDKAEAGLRAAIEAYDAIGPMPLEQRGTARSLLGLLLLSTGRYAEAAVATRSAREEWAGLPGRSPLELDPVYHYRRGMIAAASGDLQAAVSDYRAALAMTWPAGASGRMAQFDVSILLAEADCAIGGVAAAAELANLQQRLGEQVDYDDPRWLARLLQAQALCAIAEGRSDDALAALRQAAVHDDGLAPGFADEIARRELLHAKVLAMLGEVAAAEAMRAQAKARLAAVGLADHPLLDADR
jgi:eukaryotic-like serine/threonine-protein kinase